jgi:chorismate-pyruvate lyase
MAPRSDPRREPLRALPPNDAPAVARSLELVQAIGLGAAEFGRFREVPAAEVPEVPRRLLDHRSHMTVVMERFHGGPVALRVVAERTVAAAEPGGRYVREILLVRGDGTVVQHGIVRIDLAAVPAPTAAAIRDRRVPLGRILVDAGLLCDVQGVRLLEITTGPHLAALFGRAAGAVAFGRVAEIRVAGAAAVELLEIVPPA